MNRNFTATLPLINTGTLSKLRYFNSKMFFMKAILDAPSAVISIFVTLIFLTASQTKKIVKVIIDSIQRFTISNFLGF